MKLVLAEKPSVAQSLAKVLGANKRCDGYLEGNGYIVSWCVGHLVELSPPEAYDETYAKWRLSDLPILPATWKYQVSASTRKQFGILKKLMKRDDVEKRFTEDTLLSAMETAGAEDIPEDAERKGLGTPATRAGTIEKLVQKGFMDRKGDKKTRYLVSTDKGNSLITVMPEQIQSASMTADWEQKLLRMEHGDYEARDFMREITDMISGLVQNYEAVKGAETLMSDHKRVGACPCCQADVLEKQKGWFCSNKECRFVLWKDNAFFKSIGKHLSSGMVEKLLSDGRIRLKDCKSQKSGKNYNATLLLSTEENGRANFHLEFENSRSGTKGGGEK